MNRQVVSKPSLCFLCTCSRRDCVLLSCVWLSPNGFCFFLVLYRVGCCCFCKYHGIFRFYGQISTNHDYLYPSVEIFSRFDRLLVLSRGRNAYFGPIGKPLADYFSTIGHPIPSYANPAEFLLSLVNSDFTDDRIITFILEKWENSSDLQLLTQHRGHTTTLDANSPSTQEVLILSVLRPPLYLECWILIRRQFTLVYKDPMRFFGRLFVTQGVSLLFALIYFNARVMEQDQVFNKLWYLIFVLAACTSMCIAGVHIYSEDLKVISKEIKNNMLRPVSYIIANTLFQLPTILCMGCTMQLVAGNGVMGFPLEQAETMILLQSVTLCAYDALAELIAVTIADQMMGMLTYLALWFIGFIFSGT